MWSFEGYIIIIISIFQIIYLFLIFYRLRLIFVKPRSFGKEVRPNSFQGAGPQGCRKLFCCKMGIRSHFLNRDIEPQTILIKGNAESVSIPLFLGLL